MSDVQFNSLFNKNNNVLCLCMCVWIYLLIHNMPPQLARELFCLCSCVCVCADKHQIAYDERTKILKTLYVYNIYYYR